MKLIIKETYEQLSRQIADDITEIMQEAAKPLLCTASGDTPTGLYKQLVGRGAGRNWHFIGLDEWVGMNGNDEGSCREYTDKNLFSPLQIDSSRICFFDGRAADLQHECAKALACIHELDGIDVAILGVGMNGHVGLNEPGVSPDLQAHVMDIHPVTRQTGQKYFKTTTALRQGITLGIASLMKAKHPFVIISGKHKANIAKEVIEQEITVMRPASLLRAHPAARFYLDKDAAAQLTPYDR